MNEQEIIEDLKYYKDMVGMTLFLLPIDEIKESLDKEIRVLFQESRDLVKESERLLFEYQQIETRKRKIPIDLLEEKSKELEKISALIVKNSSKQVILYSGIVKWLSDLTHTDITRLDNIYTVLIERHFKAVGLFNQNISQRLMEFVIWV